MAIDIVKAEVKDLDLIAELLKQNDLPYQDIKTAGKDFFLAYDNSLFIGCVGLEKFVRIALLRSVVVKEEYRNKSYGKQICSSLVEYAKAQGIKELYLLTTIAKDFFEKIGFETIERNSTPDRIKNTTEFSSLCPASAVCLKLCLSKVYLTQMI